MINARLKHEFTIYNEYIKYDMCKRVCIEIGDPPFSKDGQKLSVEEGNIL